MVSPSSLTILLSSVLSLTSAQFYGFLNNYDADCYSDEFAGSSSCFAAMHRLCMTNDLGSAAYPQEVGHNEVSFLCMNSTYYDVYYSVLPDCAATAATTGATQYVPSFLFVCGELEAQDAVTEESVLTCDVEGPPAATQKLTASAILITSMAPSVYHRSSGLKPLAWHVSRGMGITM
jgi:hypothetical protein